MDHTYIRTSLTEGPCRRAVWVLTSALAAWRWLLAAVSATSFELGRALQNMRTRSRRHARGSTRRAAGNYRSRGAKPKFCINERLARRRTRNRLPTPGLVAFTVCLRAALYLQHGMFCLTTSAVRTYSILLAFVCGRYSLRLAASDMLNAAYLEHSGTGGSDLVAENIWY